MGIGVRVDDRVAVQIWGSQLQQARATLNITRADDGRPQNVLANVNDVDGDRSRTSQQTRINVTGELTSIAIDAIDPTPPSGPGQVYTLAVLLRDGVAYAHPVADYLYTGNFPSWPGKKISPLEGPGFVHNNRIANDIAPADIEHTLGVANALRRIDGFIWYYHCSSDVASRALRATLRDVGDGLPTGMTSGINTSIKNYPSAGVLTLTANEEGVIYVNAATGKSFAASLDNSALTIEDITTEPDPFPYWAQPSDVGELFFLHANEESADRETIYIIEEEWIRP